MTSPRIAIAGCKHTTKELIASLRREGLSIDHCITISAEKARSQEVAGYLDLRPYLDSINTPYTIANKYSLLDEGDRQRITEQKLDLLLVMGWQRLIPDWFLETLRFGAFGMHGSSLPLPHGRGRSPLNWSLIQDKKQFYTHLFQYLPGVDDGPIAGVMTFDITPFDTCLTLHYKNTVAMGKLCVEVIPKILSGSAVLTPQPKEGATYYPKRSREDGAIFWADSAQTICNLVRAVTKPFPGAFAKLASHSELEVTIWRAIPFDTQLSWPHAAPGLILETFENGDFLVQTGDFPLLVQDYEMHSPGTLAVGLRLGDGLPERKVWSNLPA